MAAIWTLGFRPRFTLDGSPYTTRSYGIVASSEWDLGDVLLEAGDGLIDESTNTAEATGAALEAVGNTTSGQPDALELRPYFFGNTGQKVTSVAIFDRKTVWMADDVTDTTEGGSAVIEDVGLQMDVQLIGGNWGLNADAAETGGLPSVSCIDIEPIRGLWLVVASTKISDQFTFLDQSV